MKHPSLFSGGCDGFSVASEWMGWTNVAHVEIDKWNQNLLRQNFPESEVYGDIREFNRTEAAKYRGCIDIITGGFPCQPFSSAGKREGTEDDRYLWPEMLETIRAIQPAFVVGENVAGVLSMEGTCRRWKDDLELAGYEVSLFDIPAYSVGLQTLERHIWIVAQTTDIRFEGSVQESDTNLRSTERKLQRGYQGEGDRRNISDTEFCRMDKRVSQKLDKDQKHRLIALGNAVPPQIPYEIFKAIEHISSKQP